MTSINVGIPPAELINQHLIAEHREIKRIPNCIAKGKYNMEGIPDKFKYLQDNFKRMQGYIGRRATFTYFERTKKGSYRHPLFKTIRDYE